LKGRARPLNFKEKSDVVKRFGSSMGPTYHFQFDFPLGEKVPSGDIWGWD
jgi:hypothetical protein